MRNLASLKVTVSCKQLFDDLVGNRADIDYVAASVSFGIIRDLQRSHGLVVKFMCGLCFISARFWLHYDMTALIANNIY